DGVSDALAGWIAERWSQRSRLGALLGPIADKALLAAVYIALGFAGELPNWLVILVVLRDLLIVGGYLLSHGVNAPEPLFISKVNTLVQIALIGFVLARLGPRIDPELVTSFLLAAAGATADRSAPSY